MSQGDARAAWESLRGTGRDGLACPLLLAQATAPGHDGGGPEGQRPGHLGSKGAAETRTLARVLQWERVSWAHGKPDGGCGPGLAETGESAPDLEAAHRLQGDRVGQAWITAEAAETRSIKAHIHRLIATERATWIGCLIAQSGCSRPKGLIGHSSPHCDRAVKHSIATGVAMDNNLKIGESKGRPATGYDPNHQRCVPECGVVQRVEIGGEIERKCVTEAQNTTIGAGSGCTTLAIHNSLSG